ncbi:SCP2 sterol-binding domain-containing protein [Streptomyces spectabilis]|uniref:Acyl-CoA synthase n=1 Tax=Streptomyces spectabilis TaxID=68270 RepID=A0A5P2X4Z9_STRST|nr:SCP2 sterol-binding domain-containing protein [Streptomyces spectabilis]MBB5106191.1 putative lipid carrier protein YhbT [Streptomyces spectabilis]MCI3902804.1 SCP2 sterol-binding domain-containing protein [Streptomyces spectabilis]QEV60097.1 acyl-CoA synthase [Streptomyces spectabilis]GGV45035.1 sterol-binding protein [Streptomyces spectabilis]
MGTDKAEGIAGLDFSSVTPEEFARIVKGLSGKDISAIATDAPLRGRVLREVFARMERQFRPEAAGTLKALIRWQVTGSEGVEDTVYETDIAEGACAVRAGRSEAEPRVTLVMGDAEFLKLVSGNANPVTLFMTRKLKVVGDVALAAGLTRYFDIPKV